MNMEECNHCLNISSLPRHWFWLFLISVVKTQVDSKRIFLLTQKPIWGILNKVISICIVVIIKIMLFLYFCISYIMSYFSGMTPLNKVYCSFIDLLIWLTFNIIYGSENIHVFTHMVLTKKQQLFQYYN